MLQLFILFSLDVALAADLPVPEKLFPMSRISPVHFQEDWKEWGDFFETGSFHPDLFSNEFSPSSFFYKLREYNLDKFAQLLAQVFAKDVGRWVEVKNRNKKDPYPFVQPEEYKKLLLYIDEIAHERASSLSAFTHDENVKWIELQKWTWMVRLRVHAPANSLELEYWEHFKTWLPSSEMIVMSLYESEPSFQRHWIKERRIFRTRVTELLLFGMQKGGIHPHSLLPIYGVNPAKIEDALFKWNSTFLASTQVILNSESLTGLFSNQIQSWLLHADETSFLQSMGKLRFTLREHTNKYPTIFKRLEKLLPSSFWTTRRSEQWKEWVKKARCIDMVYTQKQEEKLN